MTGVTAVVVETAVLRALQKQGLICAVQVSPSGPTARHPSPTKRAMPSVADIRIDGLCRRHIEFAPCAVALASFYLAAPKQGRGIFGI
jgi:hypothetical protein